MALFALADCNNFYASCERVFQPRLNGKPVVVLSNNDGCVIARSEEAKALGIGMGDVEFKVRAMMRTHGVQVFSSNYALYGDMSGRVMRILGDAAPHSEVYSIDECFLDFADTADPERHARIARERVKRWTGIPISIGMGASKVLAKAANKLAKKATGGVLWITPENADEWLELLPVEKVWGIGRSLTTRLAAVGITTARGLRDVEPRWARQEMGVVGERLVLELRGLSCMEIEEVAPPKKNVVCAKGFGRLLTDRRDVEEALASYVDIAATKVRAQGSVVGTMQVFLQTSVFREDLPQYCPHRVAVLNEATAYTPALIEHAHRLLRSMWRDGFAFKKVGVMLLDLHETTQLSLFEPRGNEAARSRLQAAADQLGDLVRWGSMGFDTSWRLRAERRTPRYTTRLDELPTARAA